MDFDTFTNFALSMASTVVAFVALWVGYRHNVGWKPVVLITSRGMVDRGKKLPLLWATLEFEVWNRRKYPIVVRLTTIRAWGLKFDTDETRHGEWEMISGSKVLNVEQAVIEPNGHLNFSMEVPFSRQELPDIDARFGINVQYYDPRLNQQLSAIASYAFEFRDFLTELFAEGATAGDIRSASSLTLPT